MARLARIATGKPSKPTSDRLMRAQHWTVDAAAYDVSYKNVARERGIERLRERARREVTRAWTPGRHALDSARERASGQAARSNSPVLGPRRRSCGGVVEVMYKGVVLQPGRR